MTAHATQAMSETALPTPIEGLLLQRYEMLLLDAVYDFGPDHVEVGATVTARHPLVDDPRGMPAWVGIELMAQAVSVFSSLELRAQGQALRIGLLLGARAYEAHVPFFPASARLRVRAVLALRDATGLGVFDCTISERGELLARGQVKGYMPANIDEILEAGARG